MDQPQGFRHGEMQRDEKASAVWTLLSYQVTDTQIAPFGATEQ